MPEKEESGDKAEEKWITIGGKKIRIPAGEEGEELVRDKLPSVRGQKESNTKEAQKSIYKIRFDLLKSIFKPRDEVVFAEYNKSGIIAGLNGDIINILCEGRTYPILKNHVFKKSELLGNRHWDTMTNVDRVEILKTCNLPAFYNKQNWGNLAIEIRTQLLKGTSPAGMSTSTPGTNNAIYNPINEEKTVSSRIKEEITRQHNTKYEEDGGKNGGKDNDKSGDKNDDNGDKDEKKYKDEKKGKEKKQ